VQQHNQAAAEFAQSMSTLSQGLNEFQNQYYQEQQRIKQQEKINKQKQRDLAQSIRDAANARKQAKLDNQNQVGPGGFPILDPYSTPERNPGAYGLPPSQPKAQSQPQGQAGSAPTANDILNSLFAEKKPSSSARFFEVRLPRSANCDGGYQGFVFDQATLEYVHALEINNQTYYSEFSAMWRDIKFTGKHCVFEVVPSTYNSAIH
jgi:hypothetical protein